MKKYKKSINEKVICKNYGSIPHMSTSKMTQQADKKITMGQELILTKKARDYKDLIIVTEKIDGSNVGVLKKDGKLIPITRSGYTALSSPYKQHHEFNKWVYGNNKLFSWLPEGCRVCGEWTIQTHGIKYNIESESPFMAFDIIDKNNKRLTFLNTLKLCVKYNIPVVRLLHIGQPINIKNAVDLLYKNPYGKTKTPEGVVYRVERNNNVEFLAKWVRADKEDGKYIKYGIYNEGWQTAIKK